MFGLTADGVVGRSTWNKLKEVGLAVANKIVAANVAPGQFTDVYKRQFIWFPSRSNEPLNASATF